VLVGLALQILTGRPLLGSMDLGASGIDAHSRLLMVGRPAELARLSKRPDLFGIAPAPSNSAT
jgi:hypothetical protein